MSEEHLISVDSEELAKRCVEICTERKAVDIILFDVREKTILADFYLVCGATSLPHIRALADNLRRDLLALGMRPRGEDGDPASHWVVLDYGILIVHILDPERREFYRLEQLWDDRKVIFRGGAAPAPAPAPRRPLQAPQSNSEE